MASTDANWGWAAPDLTQEDGPGTNDESRGEQTEGGTAAVPRTVPRDYVSADTADTVSLVLLAKCPEKQPEMIMDKTMRKIHDLALGHHSTTAMYHLGTVQGPVVASFDYNPSLMVAAMVSGGAP